jgi:FkbM family methyltransferase
VTLLKRAALASARAAGVDLVRLRGIRHPVGRRALLMRYLGIDLVVDVGANRGQFGLEIRAAGYAGRIVSIEPLPAPFRDLARLARRDGRWTVLNSAVGSHAGTASIHVAANGGASSSFLPMLELHARSAPEAMYVGDERVELVALDDLVLGQIEDTAVLFTKMDVQGYELQVLAGAEATLRRSALVQLEMSLLPLYETAPSYRDVLDAMGTRGFRLVGIEPGFASPTGLLLQADGLFVGDAAIRSLAGVPRA